MNIRYPLYEGVYRILTLKIGQFSVVIMLCNHHLLSLEFKWGNNLRHTR